MATSRRGAGDSRLLWLARNGRHYSPYYLFNRKPHSIILGQRYLFWVSPDNGMRLRVFPLRMLNRMFRLNMSRGERRRVRVTIVLHTAANRKRVRGARALWLARSDRSDGNSYVFFHLKPICSECSWRPGVTWRAAKGGDELARACSVQFQQMFRVRVKHGECRRVLVAMEMEPPVYRQRG